MNTLIVGGTGMLQGLALHLLSKGNTLTVLARSKQSLDHLLDQADDLPGALLTLQQDYRDDEGLKDALQQALEIHGPMTKAVCWIHSTAPNALQIVAEAVAFPGMPLHPHACDLLHILGSANADPSKTKDSPTFAHLEGLTYRTATLGFVKEPTGSRWLTHDEIWRGTARALTSTKKHSIIGTVRPWSARP